MSADASEKEKEKRSSRRVAPPVEDNDARRRDQEARRARGEISCAECTRLKLRCDKKVPCSTCVRRERPSICPNGISWSGTETRFLLSDTEQLHRKLYEMSERIRQLEVALAQSTPSGNAHPLLREELLAIKRGNDSAEADVSTQEDDRLEDFGTLSISSDGISRFRGRGGGGETLFQIGEGNTMTSYQQQAGIAQIGEIGSYLASHVLEEDVFRFHNIKSYLPPRERGFALCRYYLEHSSWLFCPISREQLTELLPSVYDYQADTTNPESVATAVASSRVHDLSLLLMVFATGALFDLTLPPENDEAERYKQLAHTVLSIPDVLHNPTLAGVQALSLMAAYYPLSGRTDTLDGASTTNNLAFNLGISMGLHRDPEKWQLPLGLIQQRRAAFWEIYAMGVRHSLRHGRPSTIPLHYVDCKFPGDLDAKVDKDGGIASSYSIFKYNYAIKFLTPINDITSKVGTVNYSDIMKLDHTIREENIPSHLLQEPNWETDSCQVVMQYFATSLARDLALMFAHRGFFAKALWEDPDGPQRSPYSHSFLTSYRCAVNVLNATRKMFAMFPSIISRFWTTWADAFCATAVVGFVVTRGPKSDLAPDALKQLDLGVKLLEQAAPYSGRAKRALPTIHQLQKQAYHAFQRHRNKPLTRRRGDSSETEENTGDKSNEQLEIFGGRTHLVPMRESVRVQVQLPDSNIRSHSAGFRQGSSRATANPTLSQLSVYQPSLAAEEELYSQHVRSGGGPLAQTEGPAQADHTTFGAHFQRPSASGYPRDASSRAQMNQSATHDYSTTRFYPSGPQESVYTRSPTYQPMASSSTAVDERQNTQHSTVEDTWRLWMESAGLPQ